MKKIIVIFLCSFMMVTALTFHYAKAETSGQCGENVKWTLDSNGTLTISGTGEMKNYHVDVSPFKESTIIKNIVVESGVTSIGAFAFEGCSNVETVSLPAGLTKISMFAFFQCSNLKTINIPSTVSEMDHHAFSGCEKLQSITIPEGVEVLNNNLFTGCLSLKEIVLPESLTTIETGSLQNCSSLTKIVIPKNVESINALAMNGCNNVTVIQVDEENKTYDSRNDCNAIIHTESNILIYGCQTTVIPSTVEALGFACFADNTNIRNMVIPEGVKTLVADCFNNCSNMEWIQIPKSVTSIDELEFSNCDKLTTLYTYRGAYAVDFFTEFHPSVKIEYLDEFELLPPTLNTPTAVDGGVKLSWDKVEGASKYYVYRRAESESTYAYIGSTKNLTYTDKTATPGIKYYYKLCSVATVDGKTLKSDKSSARSGNALGKPSNLEAVATSTGLKLSWAKGANATKYYIYRSVDGGEYVYYKSTTSTSYTDTKVDYLKNYSYQICSVNVNSGTTYKSSKSNAATGTMLEIPVITSVKKVSTGARVYWGAVTNATKYYVYRSVNDDNNYVYLKSTTNTSYTDTTVKAGNKYSYKIVAVAVVGDKTYKTEKSVKKSINY